MIALYHFSLGDETSLGDIISALYSRVLQTPISPMGSNKIKKPNNPQHCFFYTHWIICRSQAVIIFNILEWQLSKSSLAGIRLWKSLLWSDFIASWCCEMDSDLLQVCYWIMILRGFKIYHLCNILFPSQGLCLYYMQPMMSCCWNIM